MASEMDEGKSTVYDEILTHLRHAQVAANQIGDQTTVGLIEMLRRLHLTQVDIKGRPIQDQGSVASLCVYLFGDFQVFLNGTLINGWRKKSEAVFKYLVVHRTAPVHREKLFELFWSDQDRQLARNCLNVTMHGLRQCLQVNGTLNITDSLIQFANDRYYLNPELSVWIDTEAFTNCITLAQSALKHENQTEALVYYEMATTLYRGHFLESDLCEEWTIYPREYLKSAYISLLAQQSQLALAKKDYPAALDYCRKILECDSCNEEAHCQMMRTYYTLGRRGLALRQYKVFCDILACELDASPMDETTSLYEQIKNGNLR